MSLADELLADLEDDEFVDDNFQSDSKQNDSLIESNLESTQKQYSSVRYLAAIIDSDELARIMSELNSRQNNDSKYNKSFHIFIIYINNLRQQFSKKYKFFSPIIS